MEYALFNHNFPCFLKLHHLIFFLLHFPFPSQGVTFTLPCQFILVSSRAIVLPLGFTLRSHGDLKIYTQEPVPLFQPYPRARGEGNGNPLHYSCLENPRDRAWRAAVYGVAQSWTQLKRLSSSSSS